ncbi:MAG: hydantoinase B/oxoprolinase family protein [Verrucomicrobia bacterium]|nr:hydantoinase B/oxoprolinase family protein [Verrucomicrobiota bacterium]
MTYCLPGMQAWLSARGILDSAVEAIAGKEVLLPIEHLRDEEITDWFAQLNHEALGAARAMSEGQACQVVESVLELRLSGQEHPLTVVWQGGLASVRSAFAHQFRQVFGYFPKSAKLEVVRLRARARSVETTSAVEAFLIEREAKALRFAETYCRGQWCSVPVYEREHLRSGDSFEGPALVSDLYGTLFIEPGWRCVCGSLGTLRLGLSSKPQFSEKLKNQSQPAAVRRALLRNRLEAIVTEMGVQLQRTALSTNIRERMDFSCGLLDDAGRLLLNAPHIPVHLGALGECVRVVLERFDFGPGDVLITNHPAYGGSHLPDVTVICGVFDDQGTLLAYLANRAHHAEIGGISPGSMPVGAENLAQEGVVIAPRWLIKDGKDYFDELEAVLRNAPHPSRNPVENLIDLEAQVASLRRGIFLFEKLLQGISSEELCAFFDFLYQSSRRALWNKLQNSGSVDRSIVQVMDDGSELCVRVRFGLDGCSFDFSGTRNEHPGNLNATPAIVRSVLLYVLRMWVECDLPLNEGLLEGVDIILPHCMLNPVFSENTLDCPAVVGGNTETSQQLTDALLRALEMLAGSQATMNNFLFGNERSGYYETIGGGAGAGPGFDGCSGVHVHMTNTAITDVEVLEHRYPVRCHRFAVRPDSGGCGRYRGGDGLVREIEFLSPLQVSLLTQTRARGAAGLCGGDDGKPDVKC